MVKKLIIFFILMTTGLMFVHSQDFGQYLTVDAGGGINGLGCTYLGTKSQEQAGYGIGLRYSYFFTPEIAFIVGGQILSYSSVCTINGSTENQSVDTEGKLFDLKCKYNNLLESENVTMFEFPIGAQYRLKMGSSISLLGTGGFKIATPLSASYKTLSGNVEISGYYQQYNVELYNIPAHGFSAYDNPYTGTVSTIQPAYFAFADLALTIAIMKKVDLYIGGYFNMGLNNSIASSKNDIIQQTGIAPDGSFILKYNGLLQSKSIEQLVPMSFGGKLGLVFDLSPKVYTREEIEARRARAKEKLERERGRIRQQRARMSERNARKK